MSEQNYTDQSAPAQPATPTTPPERTHYESHYQEPATLPGPRGAGGRDLKKNQA